MAICFSSRMPVLVALLVLGGTSWGTAQETSTPRFAPIQETGVRLSTVQEMIDAVLTPQKPPETSWIPAVDPNSGSKSRGIAGNVYPKASPSIVIVRTSKGHGTGSIIDSSGLVLTNHHVIEDAELDPRSGVRIVTIHYGKLGADGAMRLVDKGLRGIVLKSDKSKDLALVKILDKPEGLSKFPYIKIASNPPTPGMDVVSIGHPASALLWTARSCEISGVGDWPKDHMNATMARLMASGTDKAKIEEQINSQPQRKIAMTTCGINPGDSGGPLLNAQGELVAVTFATPRGEGDHVSWDKFGLHIHLEEVKRFLRDIPSKPELPVPSPWPEGNYGVFGDADGDRKMDHLRVSAAPKGPVVGVMIDARQRSKPGIKIEELGTPAGRAGFRFDFSFCISAGGARAFYDTEGDGVLDLILYEPNEAKIPTSALKLTNGTWTPVPVSGYSKLIDPKLVSPASRNRFITVLNSLKQK